MHLYESSASPLRLSPEQIFSVATGVLDMQETDGGLRLLRITDAQRAQYSPEETGWRRSRTMAGVTLDLLTDSTTLTLACSAIRLHSEYHSAFDILVDGSFYDSFALPLPEPGTEVTEDAAFRHTFSLPCGEKRVTLYFPLYPMVIDAVELDGGAAFRPYEHRRTWVAFGDSITEGREPNHPSNAYTCRVARLLDAQLYNQAISGEIFRSRKIVPGSYPACDLVTVAYGTNDFRKQPPELLLPEANAFFRQLTEAFPSTPIFYLLPLWRKDKDQVTTGRTLEEVRQLLKAEAETFPGIRVIDCWDFIPPREELFYDQRLHPNDDGFVYYAEALYKALAEHLPRK